MKVRPTALRQVLRGSFVALATAGVLAVSGCATADTAAVVDGHRITEQDAQEASRQILAAQPDSGITTSSAVASLIMAGFINTVADESGKGLSDSAARTAIAAIQDPAPATLELVRASLAFNQMTQEEQGKAVALASKADITINPRYGTFDPKKISFDPSTPNWIKAEPQPAATPQG
ncbi:hypothetical protein [Phycicoccus sp. Root101]|uniref:hypothetical protein n=1 Tax=Phycicoccus sp. Root101 TaxID=1736421 RepID=UPI000A6FEE46|nr:hypothetical protein [Phycicoccus sp. Root101]